MHLVSTQPPGNLFLGPKHASCPPVHMCGTGACTHRRPGVGVILTLPFLEGWSRVGPTVTQPCWGSFRYGGLRLLWWPGCLVSPITCGKGLELCGSTRHCAGPFYCPDGETEAWDTQPKSQVRTTDLPSASWSHCLASCRAGPARASLSGWLWGHIPLCCLGLTPRFLAFFLPVIQPFGLWNLARDMHDLGQGI